LNFEFFNQQGASVAAQVAALAAAIFKGEKASKTKRAALFSQVSLPGPVAATCTAQTVISGVADEIFASNSIDLLAKTTFAAGVSSYID
jgi:hypothetical protein